MNMDIGDIITVSDEMQSGYSYELVVPIGEGFPSNFKPYYSPREMLEMGVFEGKYCNDCVNEFPLEWYANAKINDIPDKSLNYFAIKSRQPLSVWKQKGWIFGPDPRVETHSNPVTYESSEA
jgi:hypothetical protein